MRYKRRHINLHEVQDDLETAFAGLQTTLNLFDKLHELNEHFGNSQPIVKEQLDITKTAILQQIFKLQSSGLTIVDLYIRYGSILFRGDLLKSQQTIDDAQQKGTDDAFGPMISVDKYVDDRTKGDVDSDPFHEIQLARDLENQPLAQQQQQLNILYAKSHIKPTTIKSRNIFELFDQHQNKESAQNMAKQIAERLFKTQYDDSVKQWQTESELLQQDHAKLQQELQEYNQDYKKQSDIIQARIDALKLKFDNNVNGISTGPGIMRPNRRLQKKYIKKVTQLVQLYTDIQKQYGIDTQSVVKDINDVRQIIQTGNTNPIVVEQKRKQLKQDIVNVRRRALKAKKQLQKRSIQQSIDAAIMGELDQTAYIPKSISLVSPILPVTKQTLTLPQSEHIQKPELVQQQYISQNKPVSDTEDQQQYMSQNKPVSDTEEQQSSHYESLLSHEEQKSSEQAKTLQELLQQYKKDVNVVMNKSGKIYAIKAKESSKIFKRLDNYLYDNKGNTQLAKLISDLTEHKLINRDGTIDTSPSNMTYSMLKLLVSTWEVSSQESRSREQLIYNNMYMQQLITAVTTIGNKKISKDQMLQLQTDIDELTMRALLPQDVRSQSDLIYTIQSTLRLSKSQQITRELVSLGVLNYSLAIDTDLSAISDKIVKVLGDIYTTVSDNDKSLKEFHKFIKNLKQYTKVPSDDPGWEQLDKIIKDHQSVQAAADLTLW